MLQINFSSPSSLIKYFIKDICSFLVDVEEEERIRNYSVWNDHRGDLRGPYQDHNIRCFAYVAKEGFCLRANSLSNYCELNRQVKNETMNLIRLTAL